MTYFITFARYGAHLHGHESGSVDRRHNLPGSRLLKTHPQRAAAERQRMDQTPYFLDRQVCLHRAWNLWAAHVRTNHVHVVVDADVRPEKAMNAFKSYASRSLNLLGSDEPDRKRWARHGSTRWLWRDKDVQEAIRYVAKEQGELMAVFTAEVL